jgi:flagellar M-ring protein FliF
MSTFWQEVLARPREIYARLSKGQRVGVLALGAIGIVVAILASLLGGRESFAVLYGGLETEDAQEVCAKLTELGVPYRLSPDGSMVQVAEGKVAETKMQLAGSRLPRLGSRGFELFDGNQLGLTDTLFNVSLQRALQGELERSIETLGPVKRARVLLTIPASQSIYADRQARPTASVTLALRPGLPLAQSEVAAIAYSVASAIGHGMKLQDITIVDDQARLLHPHGDPNDPASSTAYLEKVQAINRYLQEQAESQLRSLGENKASVRVSVELDMTHKESSSEKVADDNKVPVKTVTSEEKKGADVTVGGGDPSVVSSGAKDKDKKEPEVSILRTDTESEFREGIERELLIQGAGSIRRMSVSLLLDEGDPALVAKKAEIEKAVKSAVGFMETRSNKLKDDFTTVVAAFAKPPAPEAAPGSFAFENFMPLLGHVAEGVTVLFVLILLARTLRGAGAAPARRKGKGVVLGAGGMAAAGAAEAEEDVLVDLQFAEGKGGDLRAKLGRFVNKHPEQAREVLVAWLKEEVAS